MIRLECLYCDRTDYDGVETLPRDWEDIDQIQTCRETISGSAFLWATHQGVCPECIELFM